MAGSKKICTALLQLDQPGLRGGPAGLVNQYTLLKDELRNGQWGKKGESGEIERLDNTGSTALHLIVQDLADKAEALNDAGEEAEVASLDTSFVKVLIKAGADPNALDAELQTPLHIGLMGGLHDVVQMLCESGAAAWIVEHGLCSALLRHSDHRAWPLLSIASLLCCALSSPLLS